jgi:hypothetical protein
MDLYGATSGLVEHSKYALEPRGSRHELAFRAAGSVACGSTGFDAEDSEKVLAGVSIDASAFVEKMSGSRSGRP